MMLLKKVYKTKDVSFILSELEQVKALARTKRGLVFIITICSVHR